MPSVTVPQSFADMIETTARRLVEDGAILQEFKTMDSEINEVIEHHVQLGEAMLRFIDRTRKQGKIVPDE